MERTLPCATAMPPLSVLRRFRACLVLLAALVTGGPLAAQVPYNYTTEGFDGANLPRSSSAAPATLTSFLTTTGTWSIYKGYGTTSSDPCPNSSTNWAIRFPSGQGAYVVSPTLPQGAGVLTFNDARTSRVFTVYTSTDNGTTWGAGTNVTSPSTGCGNMTVTINSLAVNRIKIGSFSANDMGVDNVLITAAGINVPMVTTTVASGITVISANSGGNVIADGGAAVSVRGVVWGTSPNPTVPSASSSTDGSGVGTFTSLMTGLGGGTTYYYRAYATNATGTGYGAEYSFTTPPPTPTLLVNPTALDFGMQTVSTTSQQQYYTIQGVYLSPATGSVTVAAPAGYQVSTTNGTGFANTLLLSYTGGTLALDTIYIRFVPTAVGTANGNATNSGGGASANVALTGAGAQVLNGFTNVGFDFWTGFGYQEKMSQKAGNSGEAKLSIYISVPSGSIPATVRVELPGISGATGFPQTVTVAPGAVSEVEGFPTGDASNALNPGGMPDTRLYYTGVSNRGIHIYSTNGVPISVWMHSYTTGNSAAGAMLFPSNTWASSYTVQAYGGYSNNSNPNSFFFVVAKEDNTPIWFTPSQDILDSVTAALFDDGNTAAMVKYPKNVPVGPIILNKGQVFNAMGFIQGSGSGISSSNARGLDLSGSKVNTNCDKSIAVFGGNGRVLVNAASCNASQGSDHMIQQMFPSVAWGKRYLTAPTTTMEYNLYRVNVSDPTTQVWVNNPAHTTALNPTTLVNNLYYEFASSQPQLIESDKPITVTQFIVAGGCANANGSKGNGDPEMIILSPVEQAINRTTVYSARVKNPSASYNGHYINVIIPTGGVASFRLDGGTTGDPGINQATASATTCYNTGGVQPLTAIFKPHPQFTGYSYAQLRVTPGASHTLYSDSAFNAIAYGMGDGESYGYNAGCSLKDLSQVLLIGNPYGVTQGLTCKGNDFYFRIALPYAPAQLASLTWDFYGNSSLVPNAAVVQNAPAPDSTFTIDAIPYYVYRIPTPYHFNEAGNYNFRVLANALTTGGCTGIKVFNNTVNVVNGPVPEFSFTAGSCGSTTISFSDLSTSDSTLISNWSWNFGDGATLADTSHLSSPSYTYPSLSNYTVTMRAINAAGCFADTVQTVNLAGNLSASFTVAPATTVCAGTPVVFTSTSTGAGTYGTITEWTWDFGNGAGPQVFANGDPQTVTYTTAGIKTVTLTVKTSLGCTSTVFSQNITVNGVPAITSAATGVVCSGVAQNYAIGSSLPGTMYGWDRAAVAGISNGAVSGQTAAVITETLVNTTNAPVVVAYIITPTLGSCPGAPFTYTVTVNPAVSVTSAATGTVCSGAAQNYPITGSVAGGTFSWSRAAVAGISNAAVSNQASSSITEALVNTTSAPIDVVYSITPAANGCSGASFTYTVTVYPTATITSAATGSVCSNSPLAYTISSGVAGATFVWSRAAVAGISNAAVSGQTTNTITETLVNTSNAPVSVIYSITPTANGCTGTPFTYTVTVNPRPTVTSAATASVCGSNPLNYLITSNVSGATFLWSRPTVAGISNAAVSNQGSNPITETLFNTTTSPIDVTYTITGYSLPPSFGGCPGPAFTFTVTVNPTPVITSAATGGVCSGQPLSYNINSTVAGAQYTWSRAAVAGISNAAVSGQASNPIAETLVNTTTNVVDVTYSIVTGFSGCTAPPFLYTVTVTPTPTVTSAATGSVCSGTALSYNIASGVTGTTFSWSRAAVAGISNTAVSAQSSNPIAETLVNTTNAPVAVTYTITPSANGCSGAPFTYTLTVNPTAVITSATNGAVCSGAAQAYSIASNVAGATFTWSRAAVAGISNAAVSGQTTAAITEALVNTTNTPVVVTYTIAPSFGGCAGPAFTYSVTVNPTATITGGASGTVCSGAPYSYNITSGVAGASFAWSRAAVAGVSNAAVSGQLSNPIAETLVNTTSAPVSVVYVITPTANGCAGTPFNHTVIVNPTAVVTSAATGAVCGGSPLAYTITGNVSGATFSWDRAAVAGISNAAVSGQTSSVITETLVNTTTAPVTVVYTITPSANGCVGTPFTYTVTVNPTPAVTSAATGAVCSGQPLSYTISSTVAGATFTWSRAAVAGISNPAVSGQTGSPVSETLVNTGTAPVDVVYSIVASFGGCASAPFTYTVTVTPAPSVTSAATATVCSGAAQSYTLTASFAGTTFTWNRAAVAGISNAAVSNATGNPITEALVNSTNAPINVTYIIQTTANGCPGAPFNYVVTVNPVAAVTSAATGTVCSGAPQNYAITGNAVGAIFTWSRTAVAGISNGAVSNVAGSTINEALVNTTGSPVAVIYTIAPSFAGCAGTPFTYTVTVNPTATVTSAATGTVCSNSAHSYVITSNVIGATYSWSRAAIAGISNAAVSNVPGAVITETLINTTNSAVNLTYVITPSANGCAGTPFTYTVTVNPIPMVTSPASATSCSGAGFTYNISTSVAGASLSWSRAAVAGISNAPVSGQASPQINELLVNTTDNPIVVSYIITPATGICAGVPFTLDVTVNPKPRAIFTPAQTSDCISGPVNFSANVSPNVTGYSWNFGDGTPRGTSATPAHTYTSASTYDVTLTVTTAAGCVFTTNPQAVTLLPLLARPVVQADATTSSLRFYWNAVPGATGYEVSFDGGVTWRAPNDTSGRAHLLTGLSPEQTFTITVRANGAVSCQSAIATRTVMVPLPDVGIFVPNTISPNGDGKNETLKVLGNNIQYYSLKVYSQWGQLLFSYDGHDGSKGWDGTVGGTLQPAGVYAYAVSVTLTDGRVITKKGLFNLLR
ncbi:PKD domain-containing protein [Flaviaesturariibacter flavus]|uniref:PKD domain-containing protein n=1 Tax=Flaviaesturariibacter flavus TaxID=2502780 RepID=A0A4R1BBA3_9BACT|nr:PKD-like domain-containing protein [Flaviaesturariibacter flavus]TCJ14218.1 PKD domain-containing protein [Flaviaesturariibacter flavus]